VRSIVDHGPMSASPGTEKQVALLRAVNVGGRNRISMSQLRDLLGDLGYDDVRTHLQSGNAVFASNATPQLTAEEIEAGLAELGLKVRVLLRTRAELERVVAANPLADVARDPKRLLVAFLDRAPDLELVAELAPADFEPDQFAIVEREIYAWYPEGVAQTRLSNTFWERRLGVVATGRNWSTVTKLLELAGGAAPD
jgi:uncharacterized protein (DUF1697 family)